MLASTTIQPPVANKMFGSDEIKAEILPGIADGSIRICLAYTEPDCRSDLAAVRTRAVRGGVDWILNGEKLFTTGAQQGQGRRRLMAAVSQPVAVADEIQILALISRYNRAVDDRRPERVVELFAEDGVLETMGIVVTGRAEIAALMAAGQSPAGDRPSSAHHVSNVIVTSTGCDTAQAESDFMVIQRNEQGVAVGMAGRYRDELRREEGRWLFTRRHTVALARSSF